MKDRPRPQGRSGNRTRFEEARPVADPGSAGSRALDEFLVVQIGRVVTTYADGSSIAGQSTVAARLAGIAAVGGDGRASSAPQSDIDLCSCCPTGRRRAASSCSNSSST